MGVDSEPPLRVFIANRGEIARRVIRACRVLGWAAIIGYSDADADSLAVEEADVAIRLGGAPPAESYLSVERLIAAASAAGSTILHPGYGFLSERPELAQACTDAGISFAGPSPEAIAALGDKLEARRRAVEAGFALVPGADDPTELRLPLMIKAVAGGGGLGMRVVRRAEELAEALESARREAAAAFGDGRLYAEELVEKARHVELQLLADGTRAVVLGTRDCSCQRRHQKVIEEAPALELPAADLDSATAAAIRLLEAVGYRGAATVELLLPPTAELFFLEVNTRIQVEHPVTEEVRGVDLVAWQLRLAAGELLPDALPTRDVGHAIEARLVAEDPDDEHRPGSGELALFELPEAPGIRIETGYRRADRVTTDYDGLLAKIVATGADRVEALAHLRAALAEVRVLGLATNLPLLRTSIETEAFTRGPIWTSWLEETWRPDPANERRLALAAQAAGRARARERGATPFDGGFRLGRSLPREANVSDPPTARTTDGARHVLVDDRDLVVAEPRPASGPDLGAPTATAAGSSSITAPLPGRVASIGVSVGSVVAAGAVVVVLEAMKLEHPLRADRGGRVAEVSVVTGDQVERGALLVAITPTD